jgi:predicted phage-related endonuclease
MKTLGYFFGLSSESIEEALSNYNIDRDRRTLNNSLKEVEKDIQHAFKYKNIGKTAKPKIYKLVVQEVEE